MNDSDERKPWDYGLDVPTSKAAPPDAEPLPFWEMYHFLTDVLHHRAEALVQADEGTEDFQEKLYAVKISLQGNKQVLQDELRKMEDMERLLGLDEEWKTVKDLLDGER